MSLQTSDPTDTPAIYRLKRLVSVGYVPRLHDGNFHPDKIILYHPAEGRAATNLILYSDGLIIGDRDIHIAPDEEGTFRSFLITVPRPNWWEITKYQRVNIEGLILLALYYCVVAAVAFTLLHWVEKLT